MGPDRNSQSRPLSLLIHIVFDGGRHSEKRRKVSLWIPFLTKSPILLPTLLPNLITFLSSKVCNIKINLSNKMMLIANHSTSQGQNCKYFFGGSLSTIQHLDQLIGKTSNYFLFLSWGYLQGFFLSLKAGDPFFNIASNLLSNCFPIGLYL